jgi:Tfp pilus assembly protein PilE
MVTVAIIAIIASIAIPAYQNYIGESIIAAARSNADSLRVPLEDYRLENGTYVVGGDTSYTEAELLTNFGWSPDGDNDVYTYLVTATTNSWDITVQHNNGSWIRCENRMRTCCDSKTAGASLAGCP